MEFQVGDAVLFKAIPRRQGKWWMKIFTKLQSWFDGNASHVEYLISYNKFTKKARCLGALGDGTSIREYDLDRDYIAVKRLKGGVNQKKALMMAMEYYTMLKDHQATGYAFDGLADASINALLDKITLGLWKKKNLLKDDMKDFCSELYATILYNVSGKHLSRKREKNIDTDVITPSDILKSKNMVFIKKFGDKIA